MTWFNNYTDGEISPTHVSQWLDYCVGSGTTNTTGSVDTGGANILNCPKPMQYVSLNMGEPNLSGHDGDSPWTTSYTNASGQTCPAAFSSYPGTNNFWAQDSGSTTDAPNWTSTSNATNWFVYEGSIGVNADRITAANSSSFSGYDLPLNLNSTSLQTAVKAAFDGCQDSYGDVLNGYYGWFEDNAFVGLQAANAQTWGQGNYNTYVNWGSINEPAPTPTPGRYASTNCNNGTNAYGFLNGSKCTQTAQIDANPATGGNTTYGQDTGTGTSAISTITKGWQTLLPGITHRDGTPFHFVYNDLVNGYAACQMSNAISNVDGGTIEHGTTKSSGSGTLQPDIYNWDTIDAAAASYACGGAKMFMLDDIDTDTLSSPATTGNSAFGTASNQQQFRAHFYLLWMLSNDTYPQEFVSWINTSCEGTIGTLNVNVCSTIFAADFAAPSGRITLYPAKPLSSDGYYCGENYTSYNWTGKACSTGGARDPNIQAYCPSASPSCVFYAEFNHFWVWNTTACPTYDRTQWGASCLTDIGPAAVLINYSGSTVTLSSANLSSWLGSTLYNGLSHVLALCTPNSSYWGTSGSPLYANEGNTTQVCSSGSGDMYLGSTMSTSENLSSVLGTTLGDLEGVVLTTH